MRDLVVVHDLSNVTYSYVHFATRVAKPANYGYVDVFCNPDCATIYHLKHEQLKFLKQ